MKAPRVLGASLVVSLVMACGDDSAATEAGTSESTATTSTTEPTASSGPDSTSDDGTADETGSSGEPLPPSGAWETRAPLLGGPRQETGVAALGGEVYVVGGFVPGGLLVATVEAYDPATDAWRPIADLPQPLHHANVAAVADRLVVAGYLEGLTFTARGEVLVYDPSTDAWEARTAMPTGTERGASGVAVHDGLVFLFGGLRGGALDDVWVYDVAGDVWGVAADLPSPLDHMAAATIGDHIYVVGGRDADIGSHTDALLVYEPATDTWTDATPMPTSRGGLMAAGLDGVLFVAGGEGNAAVATGVFEAFEAYQPGPDEWTVLPAMPTPRHGTGAAAVDGLVFVPGGADVEALGPVDTHEAWRPG